MALANRLLTISRSSRLFYPATAQWYSGDGSAGAIREAGGAFGKKEKAVEDQYFRQQEKEKLEKLKELAHEHHEEEIRHHEDSIEELKEQIERHQEKIKRHKKKMEDH